jgi:hypothetical protein
MARVPCWARSGGEDASAQGQARGWWHRVAHSAGRGRAPGARDLDRPERRSRTTSCPRRRSSRDAPRRCSAGGGRGRRHRVQGRSRAWVGSAGRSHTSPWHAGKHGSVMSLAAACGNRDSARSGRRGRPRQHRRWTWSATGGAALTPLDRAPAGPSARDRHWTRWGPIRQPWAAGRGRSSCLRVAARWG